jgi:hypothetical protein
VKKYGLRGAGIGGNVAGDEISDPKFNPFWAKAEQLGVVSSSIRKATAPRPAAAAVQGQRLPR